MAPGRRNRAVLQEREKGGLTRDSTLDCLWVRLAIRRLAQKGRKDAERKTEGGNGASFGGNRGGVSETKQ